MAWLPLASTTVDPALWDMKRCAGGGIILSSVVTRYQLGFFLQAGSVIAPPIVNAPGDLRVCHEGGAGGVDVGRER